jgi:hypothetical protein
VLDYDDMPVRRAVTDPDELKKIARLIPETSSSDDNALEVKADIPENVDTRRYMEKMSQVRQLRDSIDDLGIEIEDARTKNDEEAVLDGEFALIALQDSLAKVSAELQQIEMEFLFSGVVIDPDKLMAEADKEIAAQTADYVFTRNSLGKPLSFKMLDPIPEFDYSFKILEEGQFAEDQTLPSGLVYQIQMFLSSSPVTVAKLKGLSPVFENKTPTGKYIYRVGVFRTYADVLSHLNSVKKAGFKSAFIVAFNDGKELTVAKARALEAEKKAHLYEVRIETGNDDLDPAIASGIRMQASGKDIRYFCRLLTAVVVQHRLSNHGIRDLGFLDRKRQITRACVIPQERNADRTDSGIDIIPVCQSVIYAFLQNIPAVRDRRNRFLLPSVIDVFILIKLNIHL